MAAVAVLGIGGATVALTGGGDSSKQQSAALVATESSTGSAAGSTDGGAFPGADDVSSSGKPNGDIPPGGGVVSSSDIPGGPGVTSATAAPGSAPGSAAKSTANPGSPTSSGLKPSATSAAPGSPVTSKPGTTAPKPSTPVSTAPKPSTPPPSTDCTYLNLPPQQMPEIKRGSTNTNAVKQLQCLLKKSMLGIKPLAIDGAWGSDTQSALTSFQSCNNAPTVKPPGGTPPYPKLALDGVASRQTWADLYFWDDQYVKGVAYYCNGTR